MYVAMSCPNIFLSSYAQSFWLFLDDQQVLHCIGQFNNLICLQSESLAILPYNRWIMELFILWAYQFRTSSIVLFQVL